MIVSFLLAITALLQGSQTVATQACVSVSRWIYLTGRDMNCVWLYTQRTTQSPRLDEKRRVQFCTWLDLRMGKKFMQNPV
jgi:hypothetical protein